MINFVFDYLEEKGVYAFSDKEQTAMEMGITRFLQENGIRLYETRDYHRSYTLRLLQKIDASDLKSYFTKFYLISEVNQMIIETRDAESVTTAQKSRLYHLMAELHAAGLGEKYVPIIEVKQILGREA